MSEYPVSEKLALVRGEMLTIRKFLNWLEQEKEAEIAEYNEDQSSSIGMIPLNISKEYLLYEFFGIDGVELEKEQQKMIDEMREEK